MPEPDDDAPVPPGFGAWPDGRRIWRLALARPELFVPKRDWCYSMVSAHAGAQPINRDSYDWSRYGRDVREAPWYGAAVRRLCPFWTCTASGAIRCELLGKEGDCLLEDECKICNINDYQSPASEPRDLLDDQQHDSARRWARPQRADWRLMSDSPEDGEWGPEVEVPWGELPDDIRARIDKRTGGGLPPGHLVYRVPCLDSRDRPVVEWWWIDETGDLIDGFWHE